MKVNILTKKQTLPNSDLHIVLVSKEEFEGRSKIKGSYKDWPAFINLNQALNGHLLTLLKNSSFSAKSLEQSLLNFTCENYIYSILCIGVPNENKETEDYFDKVNRFRKLGNILYSHAKKRKAATVSLSTAHLDFSSPLHCLAFLEGYYLSHYEFTRYKSKPEVQYDGIDELIIWTSRKIPAFPAEEAKIFCEATHFARDLINTPPIDCTPRFLLKAAKDVSQKGKLKIQVLEKSHLEKLGANALLAVAKGTSEPPYLIKLIYAPKKKSKRVVSLVGKGITFDSGGLSIKPAKSMETMKCDMSGAAAVLGVMHAISSLKPSIEVRAYIPTTENMINGEAIRPGDVVKAMSGKTIEILNTDAEGRLILADALCLAEKDGCDVIIDLATLTGACAVALGSDFAGLFSRDEALTKDLLRAGEKAGEHLWRLPLAKEYRELIKSPIADIKNTGGSLGGAITAALFLEEFIGKTPWAHLDIAGPAFAEKDEAFIKRGGVGFGVRTLLHYIMGSKLA